MMARIAPESEEDSRKSASVQNSEMASAITGKVIGPSVNKVSDSSKTLTKPRLNKRLPRSVSEVVEEKEKQEKNVFTRFANNYRRRGFVGIFIAIGDEVNIFINRCTACFKCIFRCITCTRRRVDPEEEEHS